MVKVKSAAVLTAYASLCNVQGLQLEKSARRPSAWSKHATVSGKPVDNEFIEVRF